MTRDHVNDDLQSSVDAFMAAYDPVYKREVKQRETVSAWRELLEYFKRDVSRYWWSMLLAWIVLTVNALTLRAPGLVHFVVLAFIGYLIVNEILNPGDAGPPESLAGRSNHAESGRASLDAQHLPHVNLRAKQRWSNWILALGCVGFCLHISSFMGQFGVFAYFLMALAVTIILVRWLLDRLL